MKTMTAVPRRAGMPMMAESPGVCMLTDEELMEVSGGWFHEFILKTIREGVLVIYGLEARIMALEEFADYLVEYSGVVAAQFGACGALPYVAAWLSLSDEEKREIGRWVWDCAVPL